MYVPTVKRRFTPISARAYVCKDEMMYRYRLTMDALAELCQKVLRISGVIEFTAGRDSNQEKIANFKNSVHVAIGQQSGPAGDAMNRRAKMRRFKD